MVPIVYDGIVFEKALRLDVLVEEKVVCKLKAVETMLPLFTAQIIDQPKHSGQWLGYSTNFEAPLVKQGIKRIIV